MTDYWVKSGTGGSDNGSSWSNAAESIPGLMAAQALVGGDTIYVHNTHSYAPAATITWTLPESGTGIVRVLCVDGGDPTGASLVDGTVGNLTTGAIEQTNGNYAFAIDTANSITAALFVHGITIKAGSGGTEGSADITVKAASNYGRIIFSACSFWINSTNTGALYSLGGTAGLLEFINCDFRFGATGQYLLLARADFRFMNCRINSSGSSPTKLMAAPSAQMGRITCNGCDWSLATNVIDISSTSNGLHQFINCAIATPTTGTHPGYSGCDVEFMACAAADGTNGADILSYYYAGQAGTVEDDQTIYLTTGGAQGEQDDGTDTPYSLKMTPNTLASQAVPLYTPWIYKLVTSTGDKTITVKVADSETDADELHTSQLFLEVEYMGEPGATGTQRLANSPHSQVEVDDDCPVVSGTIYRDVLAAGADRTDTDEAWTGITETNTYTLTASVNIAEQGYIRCRVGLAIDTTNPVYVDPKITAA